MKAVRAQYPKVVVFGGDAVMDPSVAAIAGDAATGVQGTDVSFGSPEFVAAWRRYTARRNISYLAKVRGALRGAQTLVRGCWRLAWEGC